MKHDDGCGLSLMMGVKALMSQSSGTIEDISREVLEAVAAWLQDQGPTSDCGGLNNVEGFGKAASQEYKELQDFRGHFRAAEEKRAADPNKYDKAISYDLVKKHWKKEISKEEMYKLNDDRLDTQNRCRESILNFVSRVIDTSIENLVLEMIALGFEDETIRTNVRLLLMRYKLHLNDRMYLAVVKKV